MLWMALHLPHLPVEARAVLATGPLAVTEGVGSRRSVIASNECARERHILPGMDVPSALMREPALQLCDRAKADERRALHAIACWAHQFTSDVCVDAARWMIWLEVAASLRYFDGLSELQRAVEEGIRQLGYRASVGIAPTLEAAAVLSTLAEAPTVLNAAMLRPALDPLPLSRLPLDRKVLAPLQATGLMTMGQLLTIPFAALALRFGEPLPTYLRRLLGKEPDPRRRHRVPDTYTRRYDFMDPIETLEGVLFPLRRMLQECQGYLRGRDIALQHLSVTLRHRDAPDTRLELTTSAPRREAAHLFALLREKLERAQP